MSEKAGVASAPPEVRRDEAWGEEWFRDVADHAPVMIWVSEASGGCAYVNRRWREFTGQSGGEALGFGWLDALHPDDRPACERAFRDAGKRPEPFRVEFRLRRADGADRWAIGAASPRFGLEGEFLGHVGSAIDIGERREGDEAFRAQAAELRAVLDAVPAGIWIARDPEAKEITGNARSYEMLRVPPGGNQSKSEPGSATGHFEFLDACGRPLPPDELPVQRAARGEEIRGCEFRVAFSDGGHLDIFGNAMPVRDGADRISGAAAAFVDITARKAAEEALRESETRYRALFENIDAGFCVVEVDLEAPGGRIDYRVVEANPAFWRHTGWGDILGRWLREAAPDLEEHWFDTYGRVARSGEPARFEQGSELLGRWFDVYAFRVGAPEQRRVAILFNDISERRQAENALRESEARLARALEAGELGAWELDLATLEAWRSPQHDRIFGYAAMLPEWTYGMFLEHVAPEDRNRVDEAFQAAVARKGRWDVECRIRRADGAARWIWAQGQVEANTDGGRGASRAWCATSPSAALPTCGCASSTRRWRRRWRCARPSATGSGTCRRTCSHGPTTAA